MTRMETLPSYGVGMVLRCTSDHENHQEPFTTRVSTAFAFPIRYHARNHSVFLPIRLAYGGGI